ncbi:MAG: hypothetical protein SF070_17250 [Gemmatimonadota bacterium]|nr:hypothetical protein [Gemmatimonadota bacterium]
MRPLTLSLLPAVTLGCASSTVTTTVLPPHRLYAPVCPTAVLVHESPGEIPHGGIVLARIRVEGGDMTTTSEKLRRRLREEAAKLGANRVLASEVTTPGTLAALGMTLAQSYNTQQRDQIQNEAMTDQNQATRAAAPPPTDPGFYGRGLAYAIYVPEDTLRTQLECPR